MADNTTSSHGAAGSLLGYVYQVEYALWEMLQRSKTSATAALALETLDDIQFQDGDAWDLLQTKHSATPGNLTNGSTDLWRSIKVWTDVVGDPDVAEDNPGFVLITTSVASEKTAPWYLRSGESRNVEEAARILAETAASYESKANEPRFQAFLALDESARLTMLERVVVLDGAAGITDLPDLIAREVRHASEKRYLTALVQRLRGWWFERAVRHLKEGSGTLIHWQEIELVIDDLREEFKTDNLPIDFLHTDHPDTDAVLAADPRFVQQLNLIAAGPTRLKVAIRDYYRAHLQRARWLDDGLLGPDELADYERRLIDEWEHHLASIEDEVLEGLSEEQKQELGRGLYNQTMASAGLDIRARCREPYVMRGSFQRLADEVRVGWHPDFERHLKDVLGVMDEVESDR